MNRSGFLQKRDCTLELQIVQEMLAEGERLTHKRNIVYRISMVVPGNNFLMCDRCSKFIKEEYLQLEVDGPRSRNYKFHSYCATKSL